jgi:hypothetical protein
MTLLCPENSIKSKVAHAHTETTVGEEVHCCYKKFVADLEQKKGSIAAFFQPITTVFRELLNLRLGQSERIKVNPKTAIHTLEGAILNHFVDANGRVNSWGPHHATTPTAEIGINVFEDVGSLVKRFQTIGGIEHQWSISRKKPKTVVYHLHSKLRTLAQALASTNCASATVALRSNNFFVVRLNRRTVLSRARRFDFSGKGQVSGSAQRHSGRPMTEKYPPPIDIREIKAMSGDYPDARCAFSDHRRIRKQITKS